MLACCSILVSVGLLEAAIRYWGSVDANGNFVFEDTTLKPYHLPVATTRKVIEEYLASSTSKLVYDPDLGWAPRPNSHSEDGLFHYNSQGIRSTPHEYTLVPQPGVLRIALFGDSYTQSDDVPFENSWGFYLENELKERGLPAEVLNFGVSGYGMDQAFLRWRKSGREFRPAVVIFGFDAENVNRNVNLIRAIYKPKTELPFAKPRFVLDGDALRLINVPAVPPEQLVETIQNLESWDLARYEYFFNPQDYQDSWRFKSRLLSFGLSLTAGQGTEQHLYSLNQEPAQLTLKIIQTFKQEVEATGQKFLVIHLPRESNMATLVAGNTLEYADLLAEIGRTNTTIYPEQRLAAEAQASSLEALFKGHYSPRGNQVIAEVVAESLLSSAHLLP
jgi:hypothetical protein